MWSRVASRVLPLIVVSSLAASVVGAQDPSAEDPWATIDSFRAAGDFGGALAVARELLDAHRADATAPAHALGDARREVATLEALLRAEPEVRQAMAEAARFEAAVFEHYFADAYGEAAAAARRLLELSRRHLGDRHHETADAANLYATMLDELDELEAADDLFAFAHEIYDERFEPVHPGREAVLTNWALVLEKLWRRDEAIACQRRALALGREIFAGDPGGIAVCYNNLGVGLMETSRFAEGREMLAEALRLRLEAGDPDAILQAHLNLANLAFEQGDRTEARARTEEALAYIDDHEDELDRTLVAATLKARARLLLEAGDAAGAVRVHREVLAIRREIWPDDTYPVAIMHVDLGAALSRLDRFAEADAEFARGIPVLEEIFDRASPALVSAYRLRADRHWFAGAWERAAEEYARAARTYEEVRFALGEWGSLETYETPWFDYAASLLMCGRRVEAWQAVEAGQGRLLADALRLRRPGDLGAAEAERLRELTFAVDAARRSLTELPRAHSHDGDGGSGSFDEALARFRAATAALADYHADLSRRIVDETGRSVTLARVQQALAPDEAVVGWLQVDAGEPTARAWGYVVRHEGSICWVDDLPVADAPDSPSPARACAAAVRDGRPWRALAAVAWDARIAPLLPHLDGVAGLIAIPTGDMLGVPLEMLGPDDGARLGERYRVSFAPSAEVLVQLRAHRADPAGPDRPTALALGDPPFHPSHLEAMRREAGGDRRREDQLAAIRGDTGSDDASALLRDGVDRGDRDLTGLVRLPRTRSEALAVAALGGPGSLALVGPDCCERRVVDLVATDALRAFDVVHIATHAIVHPDAPRRSSLVLSQVDLASGGDADELDGLITAGEIAASWRLEARLVALTGCETGLGRRQLGEGYLGFTNVFLQRGAEAVLVSLWPVRDRSAELLATAFYELYLDPSAERTKAECLREAKRRVRDRVDELTGSTPWAHPQHWAGWALVGNPD